MLSIPTTSAFIERFFSICGIKTEKRTGNMIDSRLIMRSFLKCNIKLLKNMCHDSLF